MEMPGIEPGPFTCKANALPLSYIPASAKTLCTRHVITCMHVIGSKHMFHANKLVVLYMLASFNLSDSEKRLL